MRILVVEDETNVIDFIEQGLKEEGYVVDVATDGELALEFAQTYPYDLIILDILLPKLDGRQVARTLRAKGNSTPILMLTALDEVEDRVTGLDSGADDYLIKPFAYRELLARIRARTRTYSGDSAMANELQIADLSLNRLTRLVKRGDLEIELTTKEFALLEFFMLHPGQVLSRVQLGEHVWGHDYYNQSNVVDVYVGYLRRKIDDGQARPLLHTVRGVGYRLLAEG
ncbi:MAG: response regulator transcription factor [Anaerolineaceae bacterium]|nr:response regulator transcription factor [Anaerolineaceae bacterium]MCB9099766.1 response regulator transcription factor [Anaerolineales bacterium]